MNRTALVIEFALAAALTTGCDGTAAFTPKPPATSTFDIVGLISGQAVINDRLTFELESGQRVEFDKGAVRVLFESGAAPRLLINGRDETGDWLVIVGKQDGLPSACNVVNSTGGEWGGGVGLFGVLWPKSETFQADIALPPIGSPYPDGTRFCLDDSAHVSAVIGP